MFSLIIEAMVMAVVGYLFARKQGASRWLETARLIVFFGAIATAIVSGILSPLFAPGLVGGTALFLGMLLGAVLLSTNSSSDCGCSKKK